MNTPATTTPPPNAVVVHVPAGFPVNVPPWALDLVGQLAPALKAAELIIAAGMAPKGYDRPQQVVVACAMGARLGLDPFAAMAGISVINGRPTVWGDVMLAVCMNHHAWGGMRVERAGDGKTFVVTVTVTRKGTEPSVGEFSTVDAERAGLLGKQGPWTQYPKRMIELRARAFALRQAFADALAGFHAREEMDDVEDVTETTTVHKDPVPAKRRAAKDVPAEKPADEEPKEDAAPKEADAPTEQQEQAAPVAPTVDSCKRALTALWKVNKEAAAAILANWKIAAVAELAGNTDEDRAAFLSDVGAAMTGWTGSQK